MATAPVQTWNLTMVTCNLHQAASSCSPRTRRCRAFVLPTSGTMTTNPGWNVCHSLLPSPQIRRGIQHAQQGYKHVQKRKSLAKKMVFHPAWRSSGLTWRTRRRLILINTKYRQYLLIFPHCPGASLLIVTISGALNAKVRLLMSGEHPKCFHIASLLIDWMFAGVPHPKEPTMSNILHHLSMICLVYPVAKCHGTLKGCVSDLLLKKAIRPCWESMSNMVKYPQESFTAALAYSLPIYIAIAYS